MERYVQQYLKRYGADKEPNLPAPLPAAGLPDQWDRDFVCSIGTPVIPRLKAILTYATRANIRGLRRLMTAAIAQAVRDLPLSLLGACLSSKEEAAEKSPSLQLLEERSSASLIGYVEVFLKCHIPKCWEVARGYLLPAYPIVPLPDVDVDRIHLFSLLRRASTGQEEDSDTLVMFVNGYVPIDICPGVTIPITAKRVDATAYDRRNGKGMMELVVLPSLTRI